MSNRRKVDLDAARRARSELEEKPEAPVVTLGGIDFELPPKLPAAVIVGLARARRRDMDGFEDALTGLFGTRVDEILRLGLELEDFDAIIEGAYGDDDDEEAPTAGE